MSDKSFSKPDEINEAAKDAYGAEYGGYRAAEDISEEEKSKNHGDIYTRDTQIDPIKCKGQELKNRIDEMTDSVEESRNVYKATNEMLEHRDRTNYEDLAFVFENDYMINKNYDYYDPINKISQCKPTSKMLDKLSESKPYTVVGIHNHPSSNAPSDSDIQAAWSRKYKYGLVVCHDGTLYKYRVDDDYNPVNTNIYLDRLRNAVYHKDEKMINNCIKMLGNNGVGMEVLW